MKPFVAGALSAAVLAAGLIAGGSAGAASGVCGGPGKTRKAQQGVRLYSTATTVKGKSRVRLRACSAKRRTPVSLAFGPPSLVSFGSFPSAGRYVGFEVIGVQSKSGRAGAGTNYNIGWVDSQTGAVEKSFTFSVDVRPAHRFVIDGSTGSMASVIGRAGRYQTLEVVANDGGLPTVWRSVKTSDAEDGRVVPASLAFRDGIVVYRTTTGRTVQIDPETGDEVAAG